MSSCIQCDSKTIGKAGQGNAQTARREGPFLFAVHGRDILNRLKFVAKELLIMTRRIGFRLVPLMVLMLGSAVIAAPPATRPAVPESFMRFVDDGQQGGSLQTADVEFKNANGAVVHLIGAIHIGEKKYYDFLNQDFQNYDAVLYEMVKPKDMPPPAPGEGERSDSTISQFQRFLKDALDLDFQLDDIDYTAPNFIHADLDKETFEKMQEERGETFEMIFLRMVMKAFTDPPVLNNAAANEDPGADLISILTHPDMERQIKLVVARQLGQIDMSALGLEGPDGSVLVTERNKAALKVLSDTLASGKKKIAIFYGAAHMKDMSKRLEQMGFNPISTRWNLAWDLTIRPEEPSAMEKIMRGLLDSANGNN
jgi:hypothetical protein